MRLDAYLVEMGHFKSRGRSKQAVQDGHVKIDGNIVTKPSKDVSINDEIEVDEGLDMPKGYFKLKGIQEETGLISEGDSILDLGSSAGGFIMFASEIAGKIKGLEFSHDFRSELGQLAHENENVSIMFGDVFNVPLKELSEEPVDIILSDMTLEPMDSLTALERMLPLLKDRGKVLQVIKVTRSCDRRPLLARMEELGIEILQVLESKKQEIYVFGQKIGIHEAME
ncbi:23S rRNA (cytidine1920-2'-O)/16S rRNA (cytidine1409-2'-O)-methyltransferase [Methanococcoides vulcani]|uniref:23S rRNA (Cytidine1920-2'-O)/16S rRNA (Cytidine1409-2'-O)-methyltransferase n=1 Tax=Methanococcoides vulcani TaxID=1353158 RepID=A0A1H9YN76_9EURY|nr:S4 domain-containing protein [Methanococcoides vulcani]SES70602.1 23S rRNA (cytidine1920-2'-O)/16S rRNA (cytidine1409-2'-O)-methyltransferase [Methanococcoides vulcani]